MSTKRYYTKPDKDEILKGLECFVSPDNPDLINPKEIKDLMDKLELKGKMGFIYEFIDSLCSNRDIKKNGGLTKDEFMAYLEDKLADSESRDGIHNIYDVFTDSRNEKLPMTTFCYTARQIGDPAKDKELKNLLENADMTSKELTFEEFYDIMKGDDKKPLRSYKKTTQVKTEEPVQEKTPERNSYRYKKTQEDSDSKGYSYKRVKVDQAKNKPVVVKVEETKVTKEQVPVPANQVVEKKIEITEVITTTEKEIVEPVNSARDRYKEDNKNKDVDNDDKNDGSDSKRYHRRYRASYKPNEQKVVETNTTYSRYRRKV